jgi:hypothetical protein
LSSNSGRHSKRKHSHRRTRHFGSANTRDQRIKLWLELSTRSAHFGHSDKWTRKRQAKFFAETSARQSIRDTRGKRSECEQIPSRLCECTF